MFEEHDRSEILVLTAKIISAHVSNNSVAVGDLPELIRIVHEALARLVKVPRALKPVVPINKSVTPDYVICLEDGTKHKMLKSHLRSAHDKTPEEYRELARAPILSGRSWTPPALADGRLFLRNGKEIVSLDLAGGSG